MNPETQEKIRMFFSNPLVWIGIIVEIIFVIVVVVLIVQNTTNDDTVSPEVKIDNTFDTVSKDTPNGVKDYFNRSLYQTISLNSANVSNISDTGATVRQDSIVNKYIKELDIHFLHFIVDVDNLHQSYQMSYIWSDNPNNRNVPTNDSLMTLCLPKDKNKYPDFTTCRDSYDGYGVPTLFYSLVQKMSFKVDNTVYYVTTKGKPADKNISFEVGINSCGDEALNDRATKVFENWVTGLGYSLSEITYTTNGYCDR